MPASARFLPGGGEVALPGAYEESMEGDYRWEDTGGRWSSP